MATQLGHHSVPDSSTQKRSMSSKRQSELRVGESKRASTPGTVHRTDSSQCCCPRLVRWPEAADLPTAGLLVHQPPLLTSTHLRISRRWCSSAATHRYRCRPGTPAHSASHSRSTCRGRRGGRGGCRWDAHALHAWVRLKWCTPNLRDCCCATVPAVLTAWLRWSERAWRAVHPHGAPTAWLWWPACIPCSAPQCALTSSKANSRFMRMSSQR